MSDLLQDFIQYFTDNNIVQGDGIDAFRDAAPEAPDSLVVVYEYGGDSTVPQIASANRSIQIVARDTSATAAKLKARELFTALETEEGILNLTTQRWCMIHPRNTPFKIKVDGQSRIYYGFNLGVTTYND